MSVRIKVLRTSMAVALAGAALALAPSSSAAGDPTCSEFFGIAVHGQHVIGDYITGVGHDVLAWPPSGQVGQTIAGEGPATVGGPGPGFHFPNGFAPGASFCNSQSASPGFHAGD